MIRVDISQAQPGMKLAMPVLHRQRRDCVLLKADFVLDGATVRRLQAMGQKEIWIQYPGLESIRQFINPAVIEARAELADHVVKVVDAFQRGTAPRLDWRGYRDVIGRLVDTLVTDPAAALFIGGLAETDPPLMRHSSNVCFLSALMGLKLQGYLARQRRRLDAAHATNLVTLGVGAMLHDIGLSRLDNAVLKRWEQTRDESDAEWQKHVQLGFDAVTGQIEPSAAAVILHHHQYFDGSGFPKRVDWAGQPIGLQGDQIHVFARIAAVADQFDELRWRPDGTSLPTVRVLRAMISGAMARRLDPNVLRALFEIVPAFSPGMQVTLSNGERGFVMDWNPADPCRPRVAVLEVLMPPEGKTAENRRVIDLSITPDLHIVEAEGDVSNDRFDLPPHLMPRSSVAAYRALEAA